MEIDDDNPSSTLLDHLLVYVVAKLEIRVDLLSSSIRESFCRSLDNLQNFSDFTIKLRPDKFYPRMKFSGPNEQVSVEQTTEPAQCLNPSGSSTPQTPNGLKLAVEKFLIGALFSEHSFP